MSRHLSILTALDTAQIAKLPDLYQMIRVGMARACGYGDLHGVIEHVDRLESWGFLKLPAPVDVFTGRPNA